MSDVIWALTIKTFEIVIVMTGARPAAEVVRHVQVCFDCKQGRSIMAAGVVPTSGCGGRTCREPG